MTTTHTMTEEDALKVLARAAGEYACPMHEVGPVANHLVGPLAANRPDYGNQPPALARSQSTVDRLIRDATGRDQIECLCVIPISNRLYVLPAVSEGAIVRPPRNDVASQREVDDAIESGDVDYALPILEPRLDALKTLADRARADGGGVMDPDVRVAVETIARTLTGSGRWAVIPGYEHGYDFPVSWRFGAAGIRASQFMADDDVAHRILTRLLDGH